MISSQVKATVLEHLDHQQLPNIGGLLVSQHHHTHDPSHQEHSFSHQQHHHDDSELQHHHQMHNHSHHHHHHQDHSTHHHHHHRDHSTVHQHPSITRQQQQRNGSPPTDVPDNHLLLLTLNRTGEQRQPQQEQATGRESIRAAKHIQQLFNRTDKVRKSFHF